MFSTTMAVVKNVVPVVAAAVAANTTNFCLPIWQAERNHFFLFSSEVLESIERAIKPLPALSITRIYVFAWQLLHIYLDVLPVFFIGDVNDLARHPGP
jgi:hypothetical protein